MFDEKSKLNLNNLLDKNIITLVNSSGVDFIRISRIEFFALDNKGIFTIIRTRKIEVI